MKEVSDLEGPRPGAANEASLKPAGDAHARQARIIAGALVLTSCAPVFLLLWLLEIATDDPLPRALNPTLLVLAGSIAWSLLAWASVRRFDFPLWQAVILWIFGLVLSFVAFLIWLVVYLGE